MFSKFQNFIKQIILKPEVQFDKKNNFELWGKRIGYVLSYFLFTTILYLILYFTEKLPKSWTYFHILFITLSIMLIGVILQRVLK